MIPQVRAVERAIEPVLSIAPLEATGRRGALDLVALLPRNETLILTRHALRFSANPLRLKDLPGDFEALTLDSDHKQMCLVKSTDGRSHAVVRARASSAPRSMRRLERDVLHALAAAVPLALFIELRATLEQLRDTDAKDAQTLWRVVFALFDLDAPPSFEDDDPLSWLFSPPPPPPPPPPLQPSTSKGKGLQVELSASEAERASALWALHALAEDYRVRAAPEYKSVRDAVRALTGALDLASWSDFYIRLGAAAHPQNSLRRTTAAPPSLAPLPHPPSATEMLLAVLRGQDIHDDALAPERAACDLALALDSFYVSPRPPCSRLRELMRLYQLLAPRVGLSASYRARAVAQEMNKLGWTADTLNQLAFGVALPLREALRLCQLEAPEGFAPAVYALIGRSDLARELGGSPSSQPASSSFPKVRLTVAGCSHLDSQGSAGFDDAAASVRR